MSGLFILYGGIIMSVETQEIEKQNDIQEHKLLKIILCIALGIGGLTTVILDYVFKKNLGGNLNWINYVLMTIGSIMLLISFGLLTNLVSTFNQHHRLNVKQMTFIGIQSAITVILYYFVKTPVPFFPPWLDINVSEIPALITSFAYGPFTGCIVILIRFFLKLPGTITAGVGEFADLLLGITLCIVAGLIYKHKRTLKGALIGTIVGVSVCTVLACILNDIILIPAYIVLAGIPKSALVSMMNYIPNITVTESNFMLVYIFIGVFPFNIVRYILVSVLTFLLYKVTHRVIVRLGD